MDAVLLLPDTVTSLIQLLLMGCVTGFLLLRPSKSRSTWMLILVFAGMTMAVAVQDGVLNAWTGSIPSALRWLDSFLGSFVLFALLHFAYAFPEIENRREAAVSLWATGLALCALFLVVGWFLIQRSPLPETVELAFELPNLILLLWTASVFFRKARRKRRHGVRTSAEETTEAGRRVAHTLRVYAWFSLALALLVLHTLWSVLGDPPDALGAVHFLSTFPILIGFVLLFVNHEPEQSTLQVKLVGLSLVTLLAVLGSVITLSHPVDALRRESRSELPAVESLRFEPAQGRDYRAAQVPAPFDADLGAPLGLSEGADTVVSLGFVFPYYESTWHEAHVHPLGLVSFGAPFLAGELEDFFRTDAPVIAAFFTALSPETRSRGGVYFKTTSERATITWYRMRAYYDAAPPGLVTVQLALQSDGAIEMVFDRLDGFPTIGITGIRPGGPIVHERPGRLSEAFLTSVRDALLPVSRIIRFEPAPEGGYRYHTEDAPGSPAGGDQLSLDGSGAADIALGFPFPMADSLWTHATVSPNGTLRLGRRTERDASTPGTRPTANASGQGLPVIAPLPLPLEAGPGGGVFTKRASDRFTVYWQSMFKRHTGLEHSAWLVLHRDGAIDFGYERIDVPAFDATSWGLFSADGRPLADAPRYLMADRSVSSSDTGVLYRDYGAMAHRVFRRYTHRKMIPLALLTTGGAAFILLIFPLFFRVSVFQPLATLLAGVRRVEDGDLETKLPVRGADELGILTGSFNRMTASLLEARSRLRAHASELEDMRDRLEAENVYLQEEIRDDHDFRGIIGRSEALRRMLRQIEQVAATDATILVLGESGTGKELVARSVHALSARKDRPLVRVNCAALPAALIESELFGHEKGAFTGALAQKLGRFELAHRGTIFLDEIGELPLELQPKLLRVLQDGEFERIGGLNTIHVDVRVIAATNRDLEEEMSRGRFREDLFYRLHVFPIECPPLRDRKEDIPLLVQHFVARSSRKMGKEILSIPQSTLESLLQYDWPGNVRELAHIVERAIILSSGDKLRLGEWFRRGQATADQGRDVQTLEEMERRHILAALERSHWQVSGEAGAAKLLDINPKTLQSRMVKLGIKRPGKR